MRQEGFVKSVSGELCEVVVRRKSACGDNCSSCGACRMKFQTVTAKNRAGAKAGDYVAIEIDSKKVLFSAFLVYILSIIVFALTFYEVFTIYKSEKTAFFSALSLTLISFCGTVCYDRCHKNDFMPIVTEIEQNT